MPEVASVVLNGKTLTKDVDYTISEEENREFLPGSYVLTVTGIGDYSGSATANWTLMKYKGTLSVSPPVVSVTAGSTTTAILEADDFFSVCSLGHMYELDGLSWIQVVGNTIVFAPGANMEPGTRTAVFGFIDEINEGYCYVQVTVTGSGIIPL